MTRQVGEFLACAINSLWKPHSGTEALDGWRAIAMLLLFTFHIFFTVQEVIPFALFASFYESTPLMLWWVWGGDRGVDIFFVLSGFLVGTMLMDRSTPNSWRRFYLRRLMRLAPVYFCVLLMYALLQGPNSNAIWANFLFVNNYLSYDHGAMLWSWSLAVEVQFYLLAPLIIGIAQRSGRPLLVYSGLFVLAIVWRALVIERDAILSGAKPWQFLLDRHVFEYFFAHAYDNFGMRVGSLILGLIGAHVFCFHKDKLINWHSSTRISSVTVLLSCSLAIGLLFLPGWVYHKAFTAPAFLQYGYLVLHRYLFSAAILVLMIHSILISSHGIFSPTRWLRWPVWRPLARLSYSAYLIHIVIIYLVFKHSITVEHYIPLMAGAYTFELLKLSCIALGSTWLVAFAMYFLIEFPFLRLRRGVCK